MKLPPFPTIAELNAARAQFEIIDPHDVFYCAAIELAAANLAGQTSMPLTDAIAVLLKIWNKEYYRYRKFDQRHFSEIDELLRRVVDRVRQFHSRVIDDFGEDDEGTVAALFGEFEQVLGPVGAAKALHVLAPRFFPLWDGAIARAYGFGLTERGTNGEKYCTFMVIARAQSEHIGGERSLGRNPLKALDEYNFCRFTMRVDLSQVATAVAAD